MREEEEEEEEEERADRIGSPSRLHAGELKDIRVRGNPSLRQVCDFDILLFGHSDILIKRTEDDVFLKT